MIRARKDKGAVLIEAAIIVPIILLIAACGVEYTRALRHMKIAMSLSKELSNAVFRECADQISFDNNTNQNTCAIELQADLQQFAESLVSNGQNIDIIVHIYFVGGGTPLTYPSSGYHYGGPKIRTGAIPNDPLSGNVLIDAEQVVVAAEAFVPYRPITGGIMRLFGFDFHPNDTGTGSYLYDANIV